MGTGVDFAIELEHNASQLLENVTWNASVAWPAVELQTVTCG